MPIAYLISSSFSSPWTPTDRPTDQMFNSIRFKVGRNCPCLQGFKWPGGEGSHDATHAATSSLTGTKISLKRPLHLALLHFNLHSACTPACSTRQNAYNSVRAYQQSYKFMLGTFFSKTHGRNNYLTMELKHRNMYIYICWQQAI